MNIIQKIEEIEKFWEDPDPWNYENNPDDLKRRALLLSLLSKDKYKKILDIGCGNGFVTVNLPGDEIIGIDISTNAINHAKNRSKGLDHIKYFRASLFDLVEYNWDRAFDLIVITGVLYPQYIGHSELLVYLIIDNMLQVGGHLVTCHIEEQYNARFPYITLRREYYPYREFSHILEVYLKR